MGLKMISIKIQVAIMLLHFQWGQAYTLCILSNSHQRMPEPLQGLPHYSSDMTVHYMTGQFRSSFIFSTKRHKCKGLIIFYFQAMASQDSYPWMKDPTSATHHMVHGSFASPRPVTRNVPQGIWFILYTETNHHHAADCWTPYTICSAQTICEEVTKCSPFAV